MSDRLEPVVRDALDISSRWLNELSMTQCVTEQMSQVECIGRVDVVGIGKAAREMVAAIEVVVGQRIGRRFIVCDSDSAHRGAADIAVRVGEHPLPGIGSERAARELIGFLQSANKSDTTIFAISGGASSLCNLVQGPLTVEDLETLWHCALRAGVDITTLNRLRAATSKIAGGRILSHVQTATSYALILVDNVVSGAQWVASGLTYEVDFNGSEIEDLIGLFQIADPELTNRIRESTKERSRLSVSSSELRHNNLIVAEPARMLTIAMQTAANLGYEVFSLGDAVVGEAREVARHMCDVASSIHSPKPFCVIGAGEVTVSIVRSGSGGRCQELVWAAAPLLEAMERASGLVAHASDGRDHTVGAAGAWANNATMKRISDARISWTDTLDAHDTGPALASIDQRIGGAHTGWNLCDLYVLCVAASQ